MIPVGSHGLGCLDTQDYAAWALAMQCNAIATDAALEEVAEQFDAILERPWIVVTNNNVLTVQDDATGGTLGPNGVVGETMNPTTGSSVNVQANGLPTAYNSFDPTTLWPRGVYLLGASVTCTFGAVTNNSIRQLLVYGIRDIGGNVSAVTNYVDLYYNTDFEGGGAPLGSSLSVFGFLESDGDLAFIQALFSHKNVAGAASVPVNNFRLWATYLGSGLVI